MILMVRQLCFETLTVSEMRNDTLKDVECISRV